MRGKRIHILLFFLILLTVNMIPVPVPTGSVQKNGVKELFSDSVLKISAKKKAKNHFVSVKSCYSKLNYYRKKNGVKKAARSAALEKYAKIRAKELVRRYSHARPNGTRGFEIIPANQCGTIDVGYHHYYYRGENIARGQKSSKKVMKAWYGSASHRHNMLNSNFSKVGIAGYKYKGRIYWVQLFSS